MPLLRPALAGLAVLAALAAARAQSPNLSNLSSRAQVGTGSSAMISGFNIRPGASKTVLLRAGGPVLSGFGLTGVLADPKLELFDANNVKIAENDNWGTPVGTATKVEAATFTQAGAFPFPAASKDAALLVTLPPGNYTAVVTGVANTSGVGLLEAYEVGRTGEFFNLSTRAVVGTGGNVLISGLALSPGAGARRILVRAAGPALEKLFGLSGTLADPVVAISSAAGTTPFTASNDNWGTPVGNNAASVAVIQDAFAKAGGFPFADGSKDAAMLVDLAPGNYTIVVSGGAGSTGMAIVELYDLTSTLPTVSVAATRADADESGTKPGEFTFTRTGNTLASLTVKYGVGGSAINGVDYPLLTGTVTIPAGASSVTVPVVPNPDIQNEGTDTVVATVTAGQGYLVTTDAGASAAISITDSPATLYTAQLRAESTATTSTAYGSASILLSASGTLASVNVTFANLSSNEVSAHLRLGANGDFVFDLPQGQVSGAQWTFTPRGNYTTAQLVDALKSGNLWVGIDTARYPTGEVRGTFLAATGSRTFTAPAAPSAPSLTNVTATDAARFLTQATFGPKKSEIDALTGGSIDAWITAQLALPFTSHRTAIVADRTTYGGSQSFTNWNAIHLPNRQSAWFKVSLTAPDQLRQRVAFALSQLLVVSDIALGEDSHSEPLAAYYDMLGKHAFGNFRALLEEVTLHPLMGQYLSSLRNSKADPVTGQTPDENYAREVMQLFTIGLVQLQPDGTLAVGADGLPVPTYDQKTITEMAKVFTGWAYPSTSATAFRTASANFYSPMQLFPAYHDDTVKDLSPVLPTPIPASQGGTQDLKIALDALFTHANTAPFVAKALIRQLVTSNPSPAYVYRVAQKFENNGSGTRGDLAAVVRAILTDHEARNPTVAANPGFGKLKEPLLRMTALLRGFNASSASGRYLGYRVTVDGVPITSATPKPADLTQISVISSATLAYSAIGQLGQAALRSPTVFNFFHPDYVLPGPLATAGLVAPEFEITDDTYAISVPNYLRGYALATVPATAAAPYVVTLDLTYEQTLLANPSALFDHLNAVLCGGAMSAASKTRLIAALAAMPTTASALEKTQSAVFLTLTSPASAIQR